MAGAGKSNVIDPARTSGASDGNHLVVYIVPPPAAPMASAMYPILKEF
jgi:hypothetical protein